MAYSSNSLVSGLSHCSIPLNSSPYPHFSHRLLPIPCDSSSSSSRSSSSSTRNLSFIVKSTHSSTYPFVSERAHALPNLQLSSLSKKFVCRAAEYKFPDPIPEFASSETEKFKSHLVKKLSKKDVFGDSLEEVIGVCTEIFSTFLHTEYGGPGTLLVIPFVDMADTLEERGLPGGPQAARVAVKWAQDHVDKDWKEWTGTD